MSIIHGPAPERDFTRVPNAWLRDRSLSLRAKGLLSYIASHSVSYSLTVEQMINDSTEGREAIRTAMRELEGHGYIVRRPVREKGRIVRYDYEVMAAPQTTADASTVDSPAVDGFLGASSDLGKHDTSAGGATAQEAVDGQSPTKKTNSSSEEKKTMEKTPSASPRGSRLPDDWRPSPEDFGWLREQYAPGGWTEELKTFFAEQNASFKDYFAAAPGQKGVKVKWNATWRNWMRNAWRRDWRGVRPVSGPPAPKPFVQQADEYKSRKAQAEKAHGLMVDELLEGGTPLKEALAQADEAKRAFLAQEPVASSSFVPYIEGVILAEEPKEVTGS